jgi:thiol-disulfide isomerase/thioredoxin
MNRRSFNRVLVCVLTSILPLALFAADTNTKGEKPRRVAFGETINLADYVVPGKTTVFDFTSHYCPPCEAIAPDLDRLHAKRADGKSLDPSELSDGTRDQLYLALRVASLERLAASGTRAPVVIDDALVHFDDERARAALVVLAELAKRLTVVFFTHHHRVVELAESALDPASLSLVSLAKARSA